MHNQDLSTFREMLHSRLQDIAREEMQVNIRDVLDEFKPCPDTSDMATSESYRDFMLIMSERCMKSAFEIHEALERIDSGEYGICEECGEDIGVARLMAKPMATLCVSCQEHLERSSSSGGY